MEVPSFFRDRVFSLVEAADIAGISETELRSRLAKGHAPHVGAKRHGRITFNANEAFAFAIAGALTNFGVAASVAGEEANRLTCDELPPDPDRDLQVSFEADGLTFRFGDLVGQSAVPSLLLPLHGMWQSAMTRAAAIYASEAS